MEGGLLLAASVLPFLPAVVLVYRYAFGRLTADPVREMLLRTGRYALLWLVLSLACTPVATLARFPVIARIRRPLGLHAFLYAGLHLLTFAGLDYGFNARWIVAELVQKRLIQVGLAAFLTLVPLALTSSRAWIARLGENWKRLHSLVYVTALLAAAHYWLAVKADPRLPLLVAVVVALLLAARIPGARRWLSTLFRK